VSDKNGTAQATPELTVGLETAPARVLADQAAVVQDLQFVMDCCKQLMAVLSQPEADRDGVVPVALWSSAVVTYARCFGAGPGSGLTEDDVQSLPLQGAVSTFHEWVIAERDTLTAPLADPFVTSKVGVALAPAGKQRRVAGIGIFATSRVLVDVTGARQLGALASELAKQTALKAQKQQDVVLADAQKQDIGSLYALPPLGTPLAE
jgi:hypothetical protein